jgi:hypothetical protein
MLYIAYKSKWFEMFYVSVEPNYTVEYKYLWPKNIFSLIISKSLLSLAHIIINQFYGFQ